MQLLHIIPAPAFLYNGARYRSQLDKPLYLRDDQLFIENPAATFEYQIKGAAITADRILNLPLLSATDTLAVLGLAQTWTGVQTFGAITLGGVVSGGGQQVNNVIIGTVTPLAGTFTTIVGTDVTDATSPTAAALKAAGGAGIAKKLYTGEDIFFGGGGQLETVTGTLQAAATLDLATNATSGQSWLGFLVVANVRTSAATVRTITAYAVLSRGTDAVFTSLATDNGPGGASAFSLSAPSNGVIRLTNDDSVETSARMVWLGATGG